MTFSETLARVEPAAREARGRVLVCEDSETVRAFLGWLLEPLYEVHLAASGEAAVAAAPAFRPDVVLCDLMLPGIPGTEVCRRVRADPTLRGVPFVLVTSLSGDESRALGLEAGADDYLVKPVQERELLARVASLVRLRRTLSELEERTRRLEEANAALRACEARLEQERRSACSTVAAGIAHALSAPVEDVGRVAAALRATLAAPAAPAERLARADALAREVERAGARLAEITAGLHGGPVPGA